jgi:hypothetical protein
VSVVVRPVQTRRDRQAFLRLPWKIYAGDPCWVPPLLAERREHIGPKSPFREYGEAEFFLAFRGGEPVGRVSAHTNRAHNERYGDRVGFFGFFEAIDDPEVATALLGAAEDWLRARGRDTARGPMSFTINDEIGVLVEGFDRPPSLMMGHSPLYYGPLLEGAGYAKAKDVLAWWYDSAVEIPKMARRISDLVQTYDNVVVRPVDKKHLDRDVRIVMDIFNDAWKDNWGYVPLTEREIRKMAQEFKLILEPELALIAEVNGEPAAISIAIPNIFEFVRDLDGKLFPLGLPKLLYRMLTKKPKTARLILFGIRDKFRGGDLWGLSVYVYTLMHSNSARLGYEGGELSWTLEDNTKINRGIEMMGGKVYKRYRVYDKALA